MCISKPFSTNDAKSNIPKGDDRRSKRKRTKNWDNFHRVQKNTGFQKLGIWINLIISYHELGAIY